MWNRENCLSRNKEGLDHGFGLAAIREAVERLDGEIFYFAEDGDFIPDVMVSCRAFPNGGWAAHGRGNSGFRIEV